MAHLRDGSRLHVDRQRIGEVVFDGFHRLNFVDKLVARANQTWFHVGPLGQQRQQTLVATIVERQPLHLAQFALRTAPHVVVGHALASNHVHHAHAFVGTASHTAIYNLVGGEMRNHRHRSHGGIHLANSALHHHHIVGANGALVKSEAFMFYTTMALKHGQHEFKFFVHGRNNTYSHSRSNFSL